MQELKNIENKIKRFHDKLLKAFKKYGCDETFRRTRHILIEMQDIPFTFWLEDYILDRNVSCDCELINDLER